MSYRKWTSRVEETEDGQRIYQRSVQHPDVVSITGLNLYCAEEGLDPDEVTIAKPLLRYSSPETDSERETREKFHREQAERTEKWERETYERLKAKYNGG